MNAKPPKTLKPIPEKEMSEWARITCALTVMRRARNVLSFAVLVANDHLEG